MTKAMTTRKDDAKILAVEFFGDDVINAFINSCSANANTQSKYRRVIVLMLEYFASNHVSKVTEADAKSYVDSLTVAGKKPRTIRLYATIMKSFFAYLGRKGYYEDIAADVKVGLKKTKTHSREALSEEQARALLGAVKGDSISARRDRAIIALTLQTGCRCVEIERANRGDFYDNEDGEGWLLAVTGKGHTDADATVRVAPAVVELIFSYLELRGDVADDEPLFASHARNNGKWGNRLSAQSVGKMIKRMMIAVGIKNPKITPHSTRHFAATTAIKRGCDLREVSEMLRHSSVNVTMTYLHDLDAKTRRAEMTVADSLFGGAN